jgi:hypothetical protein
MTDGIHVAAPEMCYRHFRNLVGHLWLGREVEEVQQVTHAMANALMVAQLARTEAIVKRAESDPANLSLVFGELGCLACYSLVDYWKVLKILEQGPEFAANVIHVADFGDPAWELPDVR